jgi:hypothetical protein
MYGIYQKHGMDVDGFHDFATREVSVIKSCLDEGRSMRECARTSFYAAQQAAKGMYAAFAPDWLAVYPSEQIFWIRSEDYWEDEERQVKVL